MTKVFDVMNGRLYHHYPEYNSVEDTVGLYADNIVFVEAPVCLAALLLCVGSLVSDSYNPFLYFRF